MSEFPRTNDDGNPVWACCESSIGPECGHKSVEKRYEVATFSYMCTAYTRTALRRALALQHIENVWHGPEYISAARGMVTSLHTLPDVRVWRLTKTELMTLHTAFEWRKAKRAAGKADLCISKDILSRWSRIEDEVHRVLREIWHSEGKYWM